MNVAFFSALVVHMAAALCIFGLKAPKRPSVESHASNAGTVRALFISFSVSTEKKSPNPQGLPFRSEHQNRVTHASTHSVAQSAEKKRRKPDPVDRVKNEIDNISAPVPVNTHDDQEVEERQGTAVDVNQFNKTNSLDTPSNSNQVQSNANRPSTIPSSLPLIQNPFGNLTIPRQFQRQSFFPRQYAAHFALNTLPHPSDYQLISFSSKAESLPFLDAEIEKQFRKQMQKLRREAVVAFLSQFTTESAVSTQEPSADVRILIEILE